MTSRERKDIEGNITLYNVKMTAHYDSLERDVHTPTSRPNVNVVKTLEDENWTQKCLLIPLSRLNDDSLQSINNIYLHVQIWSGICNEAAEMRRIERKGWRLRELQYYF